MMSSILRRLVALVALLRTGADAFEVVPHPTCARVATHRTAAPVMDCGCTVAFAKLGFAIGAGWATHVQRERQGDVSKRARGGDEMRSRIAHKLAFSRTNRAHLERCLARPPSSRRLRSLDTALYFAFLQNTVRSAMKKVTAAVSVDHPADEQRCKQCDDRDLHSEDA